MKLSLKLNNIADDIINNSLVKEASNGHSFANGDSFAPLVRYLPLINKRCGTNIKKTDLPYLHDIIDVKYKNFLGYGPRTRVMGNGNTTLVYGKRDMEYLFSCNNIVELVRSHFGYTLNESATGKDSRLSSAVYAYAKNADNEWCVLASKRVENNFDDEGGKMNPPMGHRHVKETPEDGAVRECWEESGIKLNKHDLVFASKESWGTNFKIYLPGKTSDYKPSNGDGENHRFKWLPVSKIKDYDWAWSCGVFAKKFAPRM